MQKYLITKACFKNFEFLFERLSQADKRLAWKEGGN